MPPVVETVPPPLRPRAPTGRRWLAIVAVSIVIHLAMLDALPRWTIAPPDDRVDDGPLQITLLPPVAAPAPAPTPPPGPTARERPAPARPPARRPPRLAPPEFVPESMEPVPEIQVGDGSAPVAAPAAPPAPPPAAPAAPAPVAAAPPTKAPQSARLDYKVVSVDTKRADPIRYYGGGTIDWAIADGRYRADLVAAVDLLIVKVDVLVSHSEGAVDATGLAPERYTETPRKRATVATSFNRDARQSVTFSASSASAPLRPGTQDRLSVLFQIGALLGATDAAAPAALPQAIEMPVAGVRGDVDPWRFDVLGTERIDAGGASLTTVHLRRSPRAGTNDRTVDVWIATQDGGYPARVLYTEPNGSTIEMTLAGIRTAAS